MKKSNEIPCALDIEALVLGSMLVDTNAVHEAMPVLKNVEYFHDEKHKVVYEAIAKMHDANLPIDLLTINNFIPSEKLKYIGGAAFLISLTQKVGSTAHLEYHCEILREFYMKRKLLFVSAEINRKCFDVDYSPVKLMDEAHDSITAISDNAMNQQAQMTLADALKKVEERVELISNKSADEVLGMKTGFVKLDNVTGGWQPSDLIIVAGRPGMGKTALTSRFILENAKCGNGVGMISLEMSTVQLCTRLVSNSSSFHLNQLFRHGFEKVDYFQKLRNKTTEMSQLPIYFNDTPSLDIRSVMSQARIWKRKHDIKLLIIDYLQLITCQGKGNREQEISQISRSLKALAKELNIPVIALSQLSRSVETRGGAKRPMLSDLRESGAIEQDADVVSFVYRPGYYNIEPDDNVASAGGNCEFILAKHRAGSLGTIPMWFNENKTKFEDPEVREVGLKSYNNVPC